MGNPFFSIVIPTYNRADLIVKAIESVFSQTSTDWELIIIDDGSTDNTEEVVRALKDQRIKYYYQKNKGRSAARNYGIEKTSGTYICFLDSDDYYLENHLSNFYEAIKKENFPIAFFYCNINYQVNEEIFRNDPLATEFNNNLDFVLSSTIHSQQTCIHKNILNQEKYNNKFEIGEDIELWVRIFDKFPVYHLPEFTVVILQHDGRTVNIKNIESYKAIQPLYKHIFKKPNPGNKIPYRKKLFLYSALFFGISRCYIINNKKYMAIYYLLKAILYAPFIIQTKHRIYLIYKLLFVKNFYSYYRMNEVKYDSIF